MSVRNGLSTVDLCWVHRDALDGLSKSLVFKAIILQWAGKYFVIAMPYKHSILLLTKYSIAIFKPITICYIPEFLFFFYFLL